MRANFGPSFIKRPLGMSLGANAVSELQPMNPEDRKVGAACLCVLYRYMLVGLCICMRCLCSSYTEFPVPVLVLYINQCNHCENCLIQYRCTNK